MGSTWWGLVLIVSAVVIGVLSYILRSRLTLTETTVTTPCGRITKPGFYHATGLIECEHPMKLPDFESPCVWWDIVIESQEDGEPGDSPVATPWKTTTQRSEYRSFHVTDGSGSIAVNPLGATMAGVTKVWSPQDTPNVLVALAGGQECLGDRTTLSFLETGTRVSVIGRVEMTDWGLSFSEGGPIFVVQPRPNEQRVMSAIRLGSTVAALISLIALIWGISTVVSSYTNP